MKGHCAASLRTRVSSNAAVFSNRLARAEDPALLSWNYSETPARLTMRLVGALGAGIANSTSDSNWRMLGSPRLDTSRVENEPIVGERSKGRRSRVRQHRGLDGLLNY